MKPFGSITMDFQFIGESAQQFLTKIMEHAIDYSTYVDFLSRHVMKEQDIDDKLILLSLRHLANLGKKRVYAKILEKYRSRDALYPYYLVESDVDKDEWTNILLELERINHECKDNWMRFWYLIQLYWLASTRAIDEPMAEKAETQIEELVQWTESLKCYMSRFYYLKSHRLRYEGDSERALELSKSALEIARKFDDRYFESRALKEMGALMGFYSFEPDLLEKAKPLLYEAKQICEELGDTRGIIEILSYVGGMCGARGEFTEFKMINLEVIQHREALGDEPTTEFHNAAVASILLGEGTEALEWSKVALEHGGSRPLLLPYLHLNKAAALIILNRLDEARIQIDIARELNLKTGLESGLAYEYMVNGLLERAIGDYDSAFDSFENAMEINDRNSRFNRMIYCLMLLAETEVASFEPTTENRDDDASGQWLERFDKLSRENRLPGFIGYVMCLKGELRLKQGRHEESQQFMSEAMQLSKEPGLEFLREKAILLQEAQVPRERL